MLSFDGEMRHLGTKAQRLESFSIAVAAAEAPL